MCLDFQPPLAPAWYWSLLDSLWVENFKPDIFALNLKLWILSEQWSPMLSIRRISLASLPSIATSSRTKIWYGLPLSVRSLSHRSICKTRRCQCFADKDLRQGLSHLSSIWNLSASGSPTLAVRTSPPLTIWSSLTSQICFKSLFVFVNLLVGDSHADIRCTNKRGRGKRWMSHVVL